MTKTRYTLNDLGHGLDWLTLQHFINNVSADSAIMRELHPEESAWLDGSMTPVILADLYDLLAVFNYHFVSSKSKSKPSKPKPYKRPGQKPKTKHIGKGAIPISEFKEWYYGKRS